MDPSLELWGGIECTVNRVGETYFDQLTPLQDVSPEELADAVATLGITKLRVPVLWERVAPNGLDSADWAWTDRILTRLRQQGIAPIAGLVHHGSGPRGTDLLDRRFPDGLARFAEAVALRYPWIEEYTPINEPLTTARFAALYGLWYPHRSDERSFATALLMQCAATRAAVEAIRSRVPHARFLQTEDLGKCYATERMQYQADYENLRRWASLDALCGNVAVNSVLQRYIEVAAIGDESTFFCPPDTIGFNYYVTGERWLDERLERYPGEKHGGNERERYVDVAVARVCVEGPAGLRDLLVEAAERYGRPLAVSEAHLGCTREEQLRWLAETYAATCAARDAGCDVRAFTFWALFGSRDWNELLTHRSGHYEVGAFDQRSRPLRPTAIARFIKSVAKHWWIDDPFMKAAGWWRRVGRLEHPPVTRSGAICMPEPHKRPKRQLPVLIFGAGRLSAAMEEAARARALAPVVLSRAACDITDRHALARALEEHRPWGIINAAGSSDLDAAEGDVFKSRAVHLHAPLELARLCDQDGIALLSFSSAYVFDCRDDRPATESAATAPVNVYGTIKAAADRAILTAYPQALIARTGLLIGFPERDPLARILGTLPKREQLLVPDDEAFSAAHVDPFADAVLDLLVDQEHGLWHITDGSKRSWHDLIAAYSAPKGGQKIVRVPGAMLRRAAARPRSCVLGSERGILLEDFERTMRRLKERPAPRRAVV